MVKFRYPRVVALSDSTAKSMSISTVFAIANCGPMGAIGAAVDGPFVDMWMVVLSVCLLQKLKSYFGENSRIESELLREGNLL